MKFGQLLESNNGNIFLQKSYRKQAGRLVPDLFLFFEKSLSEVKANDLELNFSIFQQSSTRHMIKANCIKLQTIDPEISSILVFQKRGWEQFPHHILCMIFQQRCFSCYILITDQILLPDCLYILRYRAICILHLFVNQAVTS